MSLLDKEMTNEVEEQASDVPASIADIAAAPESGPQEMDTAAPPPAAVDGIRAFDEAGREIIVPRTEWSANILPGMIKEAWDQPEQLYVLIVNSLNDGFSAEIADAAEHLSKTDTIPARGICMWSIVLLQQGRIDEAESLLTAFTEAKGEDGSVLTNLARAYAAKGENELAESTLWHALEIEPNQDSGLAWFAGSAQERAGDQAAAEALERVRNLPGSWRAQLWLARGTLNGGNLDAAKTLYNEALDRAPKPIPGDFLMQMSGDLGAKGYLMELLEFTGPHFVPEIHGLPVGNNLIKACIDTGNLDAADNIRRALDSFNRPDWRQALAYWDQEIGRRRAGLPGPGQQEAQLGMLRVDGPIWLPGHSPARTLFGRKQSAGPSVTFLGGTAEAPEQAQTAPPTPEMARTLDALSRLTRSLPLFLAEQVDLLAAASGRTMLPWAVGNPGPGPSARPGGFVVSGQRWPDEVAVQSAAADAHKSDYVVSVHIDAEVEPWTADLAFIRVSDGTRIGELSREFDPVSPEEGLRGLAAETIDLLGPATISAAQVAYDIPSGEGFTSFLERVEQLLALRCAGMEGVPPEFLNGEREIMNGALDLCRAEPLNAVPRVLAVETLVAMRTVRPEQAAEFVQKLEQLNADLPLPTVISVFATTANA